MLLHKEKLLMVLPKRLGDVIFYTPALALIKKHRPEVFIDVIVLTQIAYEVVSTNPAIRHCYFANTITEPYPTSFHRIYSVNKILTSINLLTMYA